MTKEEIKKILLTYNIKESAEELDRIYDVATNLYKVINLINEVDTGSVEPSPYCYEVETTWLREDEIDHVISVEQALLNSKDSEDNQIKVPKVVL